MKNIARLSVLLSSVGLIACGNGPSKEDACGCSNAETFVDACELAWDVCDESGGREAHSCKKKLKETSCD